LPASAGPSTRPPGAGEPHGRTETSHRMAAGWHRRPRAWPAGNADAAGARRRPRPGDAVRRRGPARGRPRPLAFSGTVRGGPGRGAPALQPGDVPGDGRAYVVAVLVTVSVLRAGGPDGTLRVLVALLPVPPIAFVLRAVVRYIRGVDEMQQRIELEAVSLATALVALLY